MKRVAEVWKKMSSLSMRAMMINHNYIQNPKSILPGLITLVASCQKKPLTTYI